MLYKFSCKSDKIKEILKSREIIMFGAGIISEYYVQRYNINVKYYVDNNPAKWGTDYLGKKVLNPKFLGEDSRENTVIFVGIQYVEEVSKQLDDMGLQEGIDYYVPMYLEEEAEMIGKCGVYENKNYNGKRLLIDMSEIARKDMGTGIQRVVRNIVKATYSQESYNAIAVQRIGQSLYEPSEWLDKNKIKKNCTGYQFNKINFTKDDTLIILDSVWNQYDRYKNVVRAVKNAGGNVISVVYDVIPLEYPEKCVDSVVNNYRKMFFDILQNGDGMIAISKVVADKIDSFINKESINVKNNFKIGWFHMGISKNEFLDNIKNSNIEMIMNKNPYIIVGTIEPRKDHKTVLDAFEILWKNNIDVNLCIIGKIGWKVEELVNKIKNHDEYNKRLFFIENPSDNELGYCYKRAEALIFASMDEGFGLPIVEAAYHGLPIILSDIPIFKEIANENALYFKCKDPINLAETIKKYIELKQKQLAPESNKIKVNTWTDSFNDMVNIVYDEKWYKNIGSEY